MLHSLSDAERRILLAIHEWQYVGRAPRPEDPSDHPSQLSTAIQAWNEQRIPRRLPDGVPDYILIAEFGSRLRARWRAEPSWIDVPAALDRLVGRRLVHREGDTAVRLQWQGSDSVSYEARFARKPQDGALWYFVEVVRHSAGGQSETVHWNASASPPGVLVTLTPEGIEAAVRVSTDHAGPACADSTAVLGELNAALSAGNPAAALGVGAPVAGGNTAAPDETGYVETPSDPTAYVPAAEIVAKHAPAELSPTAKQLRRILRAYQANRIRWTRPAGKDGRPRANRRSVHLADWLAYVERSQSAGSEADEGGWTAVSEREVAERADAIRRQKSVGK